MPEAVRFDWTATVGTERVRDELSTHGLSFFHAPELVRMGSRDPLALAQTLFGARPLRYQRMVISPDASRNQASYPATQVEASLHNDCPYLGMPPQLQVMLCEQQAADGGESLLLDLWPVLEEIERTDPALLLALFKVPRRIDSGHMPHYGTTFSLRRGHLVCIHPAPNEDAVGRAFQRYIDRGTTQRFRCAPGDVYVNNNHRCLHGRSAFRDPTRRFVRYLFWLAEPFIAPQRLRDLASAGTAALALAMKDDPHWVKLRFGVEAPVADATAIARMRVAVARLTAPPNLAEVAAAERGFVSWQETMMAAAANLLKVDPPSPAEAASQLDGVLRRLQLEEQKP